MSKFVKPFIPRKKDSRKIFSKFVKSLFTGDYERIQLLRYFGDSSASACFHITHFDASFVTLSKHTNKIPAGLGSTRSHSVHYTERAGVSLSRLRVINANLFYFNATHARQRYALLHELNVVYYTQFREIDVNTHKSFTIHHKSILQMKARNLSSKTKIFATLQLQIQLVQMCKYVDEICQLEFEHWIAQILKISSIFFSFRNSLSSSFSSFNILLRVNLETLFEDNLATAFPNLKILLRIYLTLSPSYRAYSARSVFIT